MDIDILQRDIVVWADSIAPERMPENTIVKLVSETSELLDAIMNEGDVETELADCFILLLDLADMFGVSLVKAADEKMAINRERKWQNVNGVMRRGLPDESL